MKKYWIAFFILMLSLSMTPAVYGQARITAEVHAGYEGVVVAGGVVPIEILLQSDEALEGTVRVGYDNDDQETTVGSEVPIRLAAGQTMRYEMPLMVEQDVYAYQKEVFLHIEVLDTHGRVLMAQSAGVNEIIRTEDVVTGVLSTRYTGLTYLNLVDVMDAYGDAYDLNTVNLTPERLSEARYLDSMEVLVIDGVESGGLSEDQVSAIGKWVNQGGYLVLSTGEQSGSEKALLNHFGVVTSGLSVTSEGALSGLKQVVLEAPEFKKNRDYQGLYMGAYGQGHVAITTYSLSDTNLIKDNEHVQAVELLLQDVLSDDVHVDRNSDIYRRLGNTLNRVPKDSMPSVKAIVMIVMIYLLCAGPVGYLFLKQKGIRQYYWRSVLGLSILTTVIVFVVGQGIDFNKTLVNAVTILDQRGGNNQVTSILGVKHSGVGDVDIAPENGRITWSGYYDYRANKMERWYSYDDFDHVIFKDVEKFQFVNLTVDHDIDLQQMQQEIVYTADGVVLKIRNPFPHALKDVSVVINQAVYFIERVEANETAVVNMDQDNPNSDPLWYTYDFYDYVNGDVEDAYYKNNVISTIFDEYFYDSNELISQPIVFGWVEEPLSQNVRVNGVKTALSGDGLWIDEMTIGRPESGPVVMPFGTMTPKVALTGEVYYDEFDRSYDGYGSVTFRYSLPEWLEESVVTVRGDRGSDLEYQVYNDSSNVWESLEIGENGAVVLTQDQISKQGEIEIVLKNNSGDVFFGPQLSAKGVVQND
ncbi:MAG: hypothetical protein JXO44_13265 [Clostridia bacterium]|nr:hypothetical protein [Clostridia bacterium]